VSLSEGETLGYQDLAHVLAADRADCELAGVAIDELVIDLTTEARRRHQLPEARSRNRAAIPTSTMTVAARLRALECIDAEEPEAPRRASPR